MADQNARQDQNQFPAHIIHSGTAGTAETIRRTGEARGAAHTHITGGTVTSSVDSIGTIGTLGIGSIHVTGFTPDIPGGTTDLVTRVGNLGTIESGTIATLPDPLGSVTMTAGTVSALPDPIGSVVVTVGTVTTGSLSDLAMIHAGTVDVTDRAARDLGKVDIAAFDVDLPGGTVDSVSNLVKGTITRIEGGTVVVTATDLDIRDLTATDVVTSEVTKVTSSVDANNSTTATLGIDAVFTGTSTDVLNYSAVTIMLLADQASATDGLSVEFSTDNSNWDDKSVWTISANDARRFQFPVTGRYFRIVYTNGGSGQGSFRMQTLLHPTNVLTSIHRVGDSLSTDRSAELVKAAMFVKSGSNIVVISVGQQTMANSFPMTLASDQSDVPTKEKRAATTAQTSVADTTSNVTLLASNADRLGATIFNDSTANLKLKLGATASATSFTTELQQDDYYEVPFNYTGIIDGIWASDTAGSARITELTA